MTIEIKVLSDDSSVQELKDCLLSESQDMGKRFRALFQLRALKTPLALNSIHEGLSTKSALLKHEIYYCLGQAQTNHALQLLLSTTESDEMAEHEQMEALGCFPASPEIKQKIKGGLQSKSRIVRETCELAIKNIEISEKNNIFNTIDPSPAHASTDLKELQTILLGNASLWDRYQAMFALRNIATPAVIDILTMGFQDESALFRHEIAFVFGQLRMVESIPSLIERVRDLSEDGIVRHECIEALGSIGTQECMDILTEFSNDENNVVKESCRVGLDMIEYEKSNQFCTVSY